MGDPLIGAHSPLIMAEEKLVVKEPLLQWPAPCTVKAIGDVNQANLSIIFKHYFQNASLKVKLVQSPVKFTGTNDNFMSDIKKWIIDLDDGETVR